MINSLLAVDAIYYAAEFGELKGRVLVIPSSDNTLHLRRLPLTLTWLL
jgi:hypothetical protein